MNWVNKSWLVLDWWLFISEHEIRKIFNYWAWIVKRSAIIFSNFFRLFHDFCCVCRAFISEWIEQESPDWSINHVTGMIFRFSFMHCHDKGTSLIFFKFAVFVEKQPFSRIIKKGQFRPKIFVVEHRDHFFWIPRAISDQKTPSLHENFFFYLFSIKSNFSSFFSLQSSEKPYLNEKRYSECKDNDYCWGAGVSNDIKVQTEPRTGILAWILGHNLTSNHHLTVI